MSTCARPSPAEPICLEVPSSAAAKGSASRRRSADGARDHRRSRRRQQRGRRAGAARPARLQRALQREHDGAHDRSGHERESAESQPGPRRPVAQQARRRARRRRRPRTRRSAAAATPSARRSRCPGRGARPPASRHTRPSAPPARRAGPSRARSEARYDQRDEQVEGERAETEPQRAVARRERDERVDDPQVREGVEQRGEDVRRQQHDHEQGDVAVQAVDDEARRARPGRQRSVPVIPRITVAESRTSVIAPVPRLRYHSGLGPAAARITTATGHAPTVTTPPLGSDQPRREAERLEPAAAPTPPARSRRCSRCWRRRTRPRRR